MRRADELLPEAPKPKRGRPPKAKAQALANYDAGDVVDWDGVDSVDNAGTRVQLNRSFQESDEEIVGALSEVVSDLNLP